MCLRNQASREDWSLSDLRTNYREGKALSCAGRDPAALGPRRAPRRVHFALADAAGVWGCTLTMQNGAAGQSSIQTVQSVSARPASGFVSSFTDYSGTSRVRVSPLRKNPWVGSLPSGLRFRANYRVRETERGTQPTSIRDRQPPAHLSPS